MIGRNTRGLEQRRAIGRKLRAYRQVSGLTIRQVKNFLGTGKPQMQAIETADHDVLLGTAIDIAGVYGLTVVLAGDHHLPLLDLSSAEVVALLSGAAAAASQLPAGDEWRAQIEATLAKVDVDLVPPEPA